MITLQTPSKSPHQTRRGTIDYRIDNPNFPDGRWGYESFILTRHANGDRVLRAYCELNDDPPIIRDVFQRVDAQFHPQDASVRLTEANAFKGTAWYHFTDEKMEFQGFNVADGRVSGEKAIDRSMRGFGNHSLMGDGWLVARYDRSKGPGQHIFYDNPLTSIDHRGATGPHIEASQSSTFEYFGEEEVSVPAGTFACYHFAFVVTSNNHPEYHLWVTTDGDFMFVKGTVAAPYHWSFELTELKEN